MGGRLRSLGARTAGIPSLCLPVPPHLGACRSPKVPPASSTDAANACSMRAYGDARQERAQESLPQAWNWGFVFEDEMTLFPRHQVEPCRRRCG